MLPPLKAAKKTNSGAFVLGFVSVMLLAGGITVFLMRDDTAAPGGTVITSSTIEASTTSTP